MESCCSMSFCFISEATQLREACATNHCFSNQKHGHTKGGSRRGGAKRDGGAGRRQAGRDAGGSLAQATSRPSHPPDDRKQHSFARRWKHKKRKSYVNRLRENTGGCPAVNPRFIRGTMGAMCSLVLASVPRLNCLC